MAFDSSGFLSVTFNEENCSGNKIKQNTVYGKQNMANCVIDRNYNFYKRGLHACINGSLYICGLIQQFLKNSIVLFSIQPESIVTKKAILKNCWICFEEDILHSSKARKSVSQPEGWNTQQICHKKSERSWRTQIFVYEGTDMQVWQCLAKSIMGFIYSLVERCWKLSGRRIFCFEYNFSHRNNIIVMV